MSKLVKRIFAYIIDILIITILTQCLSNTTIFNPNLNKYEKYQKESTTEYSNYLSFISNLQNYYKDNKLTEKEYNKLIKDNPTYENTINSYYKNNKLTEKNYTKLVNKVTKEYTEKAKKLNYKVEKNSISEKIIYLLFVFLYFVGFNYITNGETLGKKIMKIKIESIDDKKVSLLSYIIRVFLMYQTIYYIVRLIAILFIPKEQFFNIINITYYIQNMLDLAIISIILIRTDGRGLHDLLAKTKVSLVKKEKIEV